MTENIKIFDIDREIQRSINFQRWMIHGQFLHGISPMRFPSLTAEMVEEIYNVKF